MCSHYHARLWRQAVAVQLFVLALASVLSVTISLQVVLGDMAQSQQVRLEAIDRRARNVTVSARRELNVIANQSGLQTLSETLTQAFGRQDSITAQKQMRTQLVSAGAAYFQKLYVVTPMRVYSSSSMDDGLADEPVTWHVNSRGNALVILNAQGREMQDMLALHLGGHNYLVAQVNMDFMFHSNMENLVIWDAQGNLLHTTADSSALLEVMLSKNSKASEGVSGASDAAGPWGLCRIDGTLYRAVSYGSSVSNRSYLYMMPLQALGEALRPSLMVLLWAFLLLATAMVFVLYHASRVAVRPVRQITEQVEGLAVRRYPSGGFAPEASRLRRGSLRSRVFLLFLLTLVPTIIMPMITFRLFSNTTAYHTQEAYRQSVAQTAQNVGFNVSRLLRQAENLRTNIRLMDWFGSSTRETANSEAGYAALMEIMLGLMPDMDGVTGFRLYDRQGRELFGTTSFQPILNDQLLASYETSYRYITISTRDIGENDLAILFPVRATTVAETHSLFSCLGYIELHASAPTAGELESIAYYDMELWYLYDKAAWTLLDMPQTVSLRGLVEGMAQSGMLALDAASDMRVITPAGGAHDPKPLERQKAHLAVSAAVPETDWTLIALLPNDVFYAPYTLLAIAMLVLALCMVLLFVCLVGLFTRRFMRSVRRLEGYLTVATPQSPTMPDRLADEGEITRIALAFEGALLRIDQMDREERRRQEERIYLEKRKREAEIVALQSQLDSHLISNLFASMQLLLRLGDTEALRHTLQAASVFLRSELAMDGLDVPLSREIALMRSYVDVQKTRYHDRLCVEWVPYEEALNTLIVPKFIMQPVLENAINHGMRTGCVLHVQIALKRDADRLHISVSNNGQPVSEQNVKTINRHIDDMSPTTHIGLRNIMERLRLRYGADCGVRLAVDERGWTHVHLWLPCKEEKVHV